MTDTWELTPFEFWVAWETLGRDRMPWPLTFRSGCETQVEFDQQCRLAADSLIAKIGTDESLYHALHALAHPDVRIELFGHRLDGRKRMVRACAATESGNGVVAAQIPGAEYGEGGNILIYLRPAHSVVQRLIGILPSVGPGTNQGINVHRDDITTTPDRYSMHRTEGERALNFLKRPFRTYAEFRVDLGPALDGWKEGGTTLQLVDYLDDGRYLVHEGERVIATPATADHIATELNRMIDKATIRDRETAW